MLITDYAPQACNITYHTTTDPQSDNCKPTLNICLCWNYSSQTTLSHIHKNCNVYWPLLLGTGGLPLFDPFFPAVSVSCQLRKWIKSNTKLLGSHTHKIEVSTTCLSDHLKWYFCPTKDRKLCYVIMHNIIWANQKTESFLFPWPCAHAMFDVTCFPAHVGASSVLSIWQQGCNYYFYY